MYLHASTQRKFKCIKSILKTTFVVEKTTKMGDRPQKYYYVKKHMRMNKMQK